MLAGMLGVSVSIVRRWQRRGLIVPVREVYNLPYFDFQEVAAARRLAELLAAGVTPAAIEKKLEALARFRPDVRRPLAQLSVIVEGKQILLRQGEGLIEPGGQLRFDFDAAEPCHKETAPPEVISIGALTSPQSPEQLLQLAETYEDQGHLDSAVVAYRSALIAGGPRAGVCFQLAELLYRLGDLSAARERYYMAVELDEDFVPARANLGCVLAETGELELAASAFSGALDCYPDYPDVHYHLARTLDELNRPQEAEIHWRAFLTLTPDSPWADEARERVKSFELRIEKR
jgi:tetratricopeptide (TPR) repeat protein